ncbi:hypothetical protein [Weissella confusa]|uniref:hypothetical protein n=1 Tax=Weissella confusa TaxID=1583 RepID=UPI00223AC140|nr:hypothetical protein [Weissella confusa]MCT0013772.1 hypothetical protein [Weissella confusa]
MDDVAGKTTNLDFGQFSIKDLATSTTPKTANLPAGAFTVTDYSGNNNGWQLSADVTKFTDGTDKFDGGLTLNGVKLTADDTQQTGGSVIYTSKQRGPWTSPALEKGASITFPSTANIGHYTADILYTLSDGPTNGK